MANERLRAQRRLRGWSQEDVVKGLVRVGIEINERQLGVTRQLISRWERGITSPRAPYPKLLCQLFQASAQELGLVPPLSERVGLVSASLPSASLSLSAPAYGTIEENAIGDDVERRELFSLFYTAAKAATVWTALPSGFRPKEIVNRPALEEAGALETVMEHPYRRLWASTPTPALLQPALAHFNLISQLLNPSRSPAEQVRLAETASEAAEFVGWLAYDMGDHAKGYQYYQLALAYAEQAGNEHLRAWLGAGLSLWAGLLGDGASAMRLIGQARARVPSHGLPTAQAWLAAREAVAYARTGDTSGALSALSRSETAADQARPGEEPWPWVFPFDDARIAMYRGTVATILKLPKMALPALQEGMEGLEPAAGESDNSSKKSAEAGPKLRALVLCDLAESYVSTSEVEEACRLTAEAFSIGVPMGCDRAVKRVMKLRAQLAPWQDTQAVRELGERMVEGVVGGL